MLFLESNTLNYELDTAHRTSLLQALQDHNLTPLVRTLRMRCFTDVMLSPEKTSDMENAMSSWTDSFAEERYIKGDIIPATDHVLFLIFEDEDEETPLVRAGILYDVRTPEPYRKLESFCREVRETVLNQNHSEREVPQWIAGKPSLPLGFRNFIAKQDSDSLYTSLRKESMSKRILAASRLEDESARIFLRTAKDAHLEGYAARLLTGESASRSVPVERLEDVGLVEREVQISCRKTGHALFRLPNAHALAVVTVSDATCSECGAAVADENVEEVIAPTPLAKSLLEDGSWLVSRLHFLLREMGVPEREIALGPAEGNGYGQMMANISGESFLLVTRDGDLTPAFARWAIDLELETEASHLVIVATGRLHREAGMLLRNHSRRRVSGGQDFEMILANDVATAGRELQTALERVSQRIIGDQLCVLDGSLGLSVSRLVLTKFQLLATKEPAAEPVISIDPETEFAAPRQPLSLAAHASMNVTDVVDVDVPTEIAPPIFVESSQEDIESEPETETGRAATNNWE